LWLFPGATPSSSTLQNPTHICYTADGLYDVTLIVDNGNGVDTVTKYSWINVVSVPGAAMLSNDTTVPWGTSVTLVAAPGFASYYWVTQGDSNYTHIGLDTNFVDTVIATPGETTTYYVIIGDGGGCYARREVTITVTHTNHIFLPNTFSPNGDGKND